jgi:hypothetical protein
MRKTTLVRKKPMRRCSKKLTKELRTYYRLRGLFLANHPRCEACETLGHPDRMAATEVHHTRGRGKYLNDVSTWLAVDSLCHAEIHQSPNEARKKGLLK